MKIRTTNDPTAGSIGLILCCLVLIMTRQTFGSEKLLLTTYAGPPLSNHNQTGICDQVIKEAFKRIHIEVEITQMTAERSITNANLGIVDGDFVRISGLSRIYPNLIEVPESILRYEFMAFTKRHILESANWLSLKPFHVGIVRGWKILEENLRDVDRLQTVKNQDLLFTLLDNDRVDFVVYARHEGIWVINKLGLRGIEILEPPLITREMFLYLHKRHQLLVPKIVSTLQQMKKEGSFAKTMNAATLLKPIHH